jgi:hypothetical protein
VRLWKRAKSWLMRRSINQQALALFEDMGPGYMYRWSLKIGYYSLYMIASSSKDDLCGFMQWDHLPYTHWRIEAYEGGHLQGEEWTKQARGCCGSPEKAARQCIEVFARLSDNPEPDICALIQEARDLITLHALRAI